MAARSAPTRRDRGVRVVRRHPDLRRRRAAPTTAPIRRSSARARSPASRRTPSRRTGQLWGNPLYDWAAMRADGYRWWIERLRRTFELVDLTRIDHFRGFVSYWAVPARNKTAVQGRWRRGPGARPLPRARGGARRAAGRRRGSRRDHRAGRPAAARARACRGWSCSSSRSATIRRTRTCRRTTRSTPSSTPGTHDNDTTLGWWESLTAEERAWTELDPARPGVVA